jgi:hypothetical protein
MRFFAIYKTATGEVCGCARGRYAPVLLDGQSSIELKDSGAFARMHDALIREGIAPTYRLTDGKLFENDVEISL